jgi:hypothetical protein
LAIIWLVPVLWLPAADLDKLARDCRSGKQKACDELANVVWTDGSPEVRAATLEKLTDQRQLARIAIANNYVPGRPRNWDALRLAAVEKLTDQAALAKIALKTYSPVQEAALGKLTDPATLVRVAKASTSADITAVEVKAVKKVTDQAALADIAKTARNPFAQKEAVLRLVDPATLTYIAMTADEAEVGREAVRKLGDQATLTAIARTALSPGVRAEAAGKLTDQATLTAIARTDSSDAVRLAALGKITDPATTIEIVKGRSDCCEFAEKAIKRLTDQAALAGIARTHSAASVRESAVGRALSLRPCSVGIADLQALPRNVTASVSSRLFFGEDLPAETEAKVREAAQRIIASAMGALGYRMAGGDKPELVVEIEAIGRAIGANYGRIGFSYEGTQWEGAISFIRNGCAYRRILDWRSTGPSVINYYGSEPPEPKDLVHAPFEAGMKAMVARTMVELGADLDGVEAKIRLVKSADFTLAEVAYHSLPLGAIDQAALAGIVMAAGLWDARLGAFEKLTDQAALTQVATSADTPMLRAPAVARLTDQATLAQIARTDNDESVRLAAVRKLTDRAALARIAKEDKRREMREAAMLRLQQLAKH